MQNTQPLPERKGRNFPYILLILQILSKNPHNHQSNSHRATEPTEIRPGMRQHTFLKLTSTFDRRQHPLFLSGIFLNRGLRGAKNAHRSAMDEVCTPVRHLSFKCRWNSILPLGKKDKIRNVMNRREFVRLLAVVPIGLQVARGNDHASNRFTGRRVIVIGSGLSGLAAARELQRNGVDVVVVEARDRVGGRLWTSTKWKDMPLDMGATWIHGQTENPLTQLADEIGTPRVETSYGRSMIYSTNGKPFSAVDEKELQQLSKIISNALGKAQNRDHDCSILKAVQPLLLEFKDSPEILLLIQYILSSEFEQEYSGSVERLSAHWFDDIKEFGGGDALFLHGFAAISDYLKKGLRIERSQVVHAIQWDGAEARVHTDRAEFRADQVVITLPLGVLKAGSVRFEPDLPPSKKEAISKLGMGVLNKCYLRFDQVFWPEDVDWLGFISPRRGDWDTWVSLQRAANFPVLLGFTAADRGREIESWSDQRIVTSAMQSLRTRFGVKAPDPIDYQISRWAGDPYSGGSYSYNALGTTPKMRDELMKPLANRLFFAGEATSRKGFGTAHGAYLSGLQAAKNVLSPDRSMDNSMNSLVPL